MNGRLENWAFVMETDPYKAPELKRMYLNGDIYDNHGGRFEDGKNVTTSSVKEIDIKNMIVETQHSTYKLGEIAEDFATWLKENGHKLDDYHTKELN